MRSRPGLWTRVWRHGRRATLRSIAAAMALVLTITLLQTTVVTRQDAVAAPPTPPACPADRPDEVSALVAARLCGARTKVSSATSETSELFANPNGTLTSQRQVRPVRVRGNDGWVPADATLRMGQDGSVRPAAAAVGMRLSSGGDGPMAVLSRDVMELSVGSPLGRLPKPRLDSNTATYPDVLPGVDLVLTAEVDGFSQLLIVRDRAAALHPALRNLRFPTSSKGLTLKVGNDGAVDAADAQGRSVFGGPPPQMWDAARTMRGGLPQRGPDGVGLRRMVTGLAGSELVITPDQQLLTSPAAKFPVVIDPTFTATRQSWSMVDSATPDTAYYNVSQDAEIGTANGGASKRRAFFNMDLAGFGTQTVVSATLNLQETWSGSCDPRPFEVYRTAWMTPSWTWSYQDNPANAVWSNWFGGLDPKQATVTAAKGFSAACPAGAVTADVTPAVRQAVANNWGSVSLGLRVPNENDNASLKRFNNNPTISVTYGQVPSVSNPSTLPTTACLTGTGRPYLSSLTPTLRTTVSDPSGGMVRAKFAWQRTDGTSIGQTTTELGASGSVFSAIVPSGQLVQGGAYAWRALGGNAVGDGAWGPWCEFVADNGKPGVPFVSSPQYPDDGAWHGGANQAGTFAFTPPAGTTDLAAFVYSLDSDTNPITVAATGQTTVSITPTTEGHRTLTVRAKDLAGNLSDPNTYRFQVGRAGLTQPAYGAVAVKRMKIAVDGQPTYTRATFQYRRGPGGTEADIPLPNLNTATGGPVNTPKVRLSDLGGHVVWNAVDTLGYVGGVVEVRAKLYTDNDANPAYDTAWVRTTVDPNGDAAAATEIGPGSVNLLTGDYTLSATDASELGLTVSRTASSREPRDGWQPQGERLTVNQQSVSADTNGFGPGSTSIWRDTSKGHDSNDSLAVAPMGAGSPPSGHPGDTFVNVGGDTGGLRLGMQAGKTYRITTWIYVPSATGLNPNAPAWGRWLTANYKVPAVGFYQQAFSNPPTYTDAWQQLTVDVTVPAGATEAFVRLYNGFNVGSGKQVFYDHLSVVEIVAPFGPQWRGGATDGMTGVDYTTLKFPEASLAQLSLLSGGWLTFSRNADGSFKSEPGLETLTLSKVNDTTYQVREADGTVTELTKQGEVFAVASSWTADANSTSRYIHETANGRALPKRVINPAEPGVGDCATAVPARGCNVLEYDYATATTATGSALGDVVDRVRAAKVWTWDPVVNAMTAVEVARYLYDDSGRLREAWDPRLSLALKIAYDYDTDGRVITVTPAGKQPVRFDYGAAGADPNTGRLLRVRRAALRPGTRDQLDGETATNVVYQVPLTRGAGGPHDLDFAAISRWAQQDLPTDATAVFGPEDVPGVNVATPATPGADGYRFATVHYLNASAKQVNTATPGGHIDTTEYDRFGNTVRVLESTNRMLSLGTLPNAAALAAELNLPADSAERAQLLSTTSRYSTDGIDLLESTGPVTKLALANQLFDPTGVRPTLPAGSQVVARVHTVNTYDEGKPDGAAYHLLTTVNAGAQVIGYPDADVVINKTGYSAERGGASGWQLKKPTMSIADAVPGGANATTYTTYDDAGRTLTDWSIDATGTDARTKVNIFYTAGANSADAACRNKPEWAGKPCVRKAVGSVTGHDPARMTTELPVQRVESYTRFGDSAVVVETSAGKTRRVTKSYDAADRVVSVATTADEGAAIPTVTTEYDPASGETVRTRTPSGVIVREYDVLGRTLSYSDADGGVTRTEYDRFGKTTKVTDNAGTQTYAYDRVTEPRGLVTSITDSAAGTFGATYSPDGQLVEQRYPGGLTRRDTLDASFNPVGRAYTRDSDGVVLYSESMVENSRSQWISHNYTGGSKTYAYDRLDRLTSVKHRLATAVCTTRSYTYDTRTNRTRKQTFDSAADGACNTDGADSEAAHTHDSADRLTDAGYIYDAFGRTVSQPSGLANSFYANDLVASQIQGASRRTWTLDPQLRFRTSSAEQFVAGAWQGAGSTLNHYGDDSDEPRWIIEPGGSLSRNVSGPDGDLAATVVAVQITLQLTNLHGDIALTINVALTAPEFLAYDEFGIPSAGQSDPRYGWLGGKQRSGEAVGDTILMGVRLYSPALGRFLSVDPVEGGSATDYDYTNADPVNSTDLDGNKPTSRRQPIIDSVKCGRLRIPYLIVACAIAVIAKNSNGSQKRPPPLVQIPIKNPVHITPLPCNNMTNRKRLDYCGGPSWVYAILRPDGKDVWKYGITAGKTRETRPTSQLSKCRKFYNLRGWAGKCTYRWEPGGPWNPKQGARNEELRLCRAYVASKKRLPYGSSMC